jgi:hypothetical protein
MDLRQALAHYQHRLPPFPQQVEALELSITKLYFALFMEQGTGKTKVIIDTAAIHYTCGIIKALLIIAPIDVHEQWIIEQIPEHMPAHITVRARVWRSSNTKSFRECWELVKKPLPDVLTVLSMNHESMATAKGKHLAKSFLKAYPSLLAVDESDLAISTPKAARTKALVHWVGPHAKVRRILTGTPAEDPFELYSPFNFLHPDIHGFDDFLIFKHRYASWIQNTITGKPGRDGKRRLIEFESFVAYQNLEELYARLAPYIYRKRKIDCLNLPPKVYGMRTVPLSKAQRDVYQELKENGLLMLAQAEAGNIKPVEVQPLADMHEEELLSRMTNKAFRTTTAIKLTLLLRLQQCVGGFITDDEGTVRAIDGEETNSRMDATMNLIRGALQGPAKIIVWARFRAEMAMLKNLCKTQFPLVESEAIYGGTHSKTARAATIARFKDPKSKLIILISHEESLGVGMNFAVARDEIFYSSGASGRKRIQAEDRCHRIGQTGTVNIWDMDAVEVPIDARMREFRTGKLEFNSTVMGWTAKQMQEVI